MRRFRTICAAIALGACMLAISGCAKSTSVNTQAETVPFEGQRVYMQPCGRTGVIAFAAGDPTVVYASSATATASVRTVLDGELQNIAPARDRASIAYAVKSSADPTGTSRIGVADFGESTVTVTPLLHLDMGQYDMVFLGISPDGSDVMVLRMADVKTADVWVIDRTGATMWHQRCESPTEFSRVSLAGTADAALMSSDPDSKGRSTLAVIRSTGVTSIGFAGRTMGDLTQDGRSVIYTRDAGTRASTMGSTRAIGGKGAPSWETTVPGPVSNLSIGNSILTVAQSSEGEIADPSQTVSASLFTAAAALVDLEGRHVWGAEATGTADFRAQASADSHLVLMYQLGTAPVTVRVWDVPENREIAGGPTGWSFAFFGATDSIAFWDPSTGTGVWSANP